MAGASGAPGAGPGLMPPGPLRVPLPVEAGRLPRGCLRRSDPSAMPWVQLGRLTMEKTSCSADPRRDRSASRRMVASQPVQRVALGD